MSEKSEKREKKRTGAEGAEVKKPSKLLELPKHNQLAVLSYLNFKEVVKWATSGQVTDAADHNARMRRLQDVLKGMTELNLVDIDETKLVTIQNLIQAAAVNWRRIVCDSPVFWLSEQWATNPKFRNLESLQLAFDRARWLPENLQHMRLPKKLVHFSQRGANCAPVFASLFHLDNKTEEQWENLQVLEWQFFFSTVFYGGVSTLSEADIVKFCNARRAPNLSSVSLLVDLLGPPESRLLEALAHNSRDQLRHVKLSFYPEQRRRGELESKLYFSTEQIAHLFQGCSNLQYVALEYGSRKPFNQLRHNEEPQTWRWTLNNDTKMWSFYCNQKGYQVDIDTQIQIVDASGIRQWESFHVYSITSERLLDALNYPSRNSNDRHTFVELKLLTSSPLILPDDLKQLLQYSPKLQKLDFILQYTTDENAFHVSVDFKSKSYRFTGSTHAIPYYLEGYKQAGIRFAYFESLDRGVRDEIEWNDFRPLFLHENSKNQLQTLRCSLGSWQPRPVETKQEEWSTEPDIEAWSQKVIHDKGWLELSAFQGQTLTDVRLGALGGLDYSNDLLGNLNKYFPAMQHFRLTCTSGQSFQPIALLGCFKLITLSLTLSDDASAKDVVDTKILQQFCRQNPDLRECWLDISITNESEKMLMRPLFQLSQLERLRVNLPNNLLIYDDLAQLYQKCPNLKHVDLHNLMDFRSPAEAEEWAEKIWTWDNQTFWKAGGDDLFKPKSLLFDSETSFLVKLPSQQRLTSPISTTGLRVWGMAGRPSSSSLKVLEKPEFIEKLLESEASKDQAVDQWFTEYRLPEILQKELQRMFGPQPNKFEATFEMLQAIQHGDAMWVSKDGHFVVSGNHVQIQGVSSAGDARKQVIEKIEQLFTNAFSKPRIIFV